MFKMKYIFLFQILFLSFSQIKGQVNNSIITDSIFKEIKEIKKILDSTESYKEKIKLYIKRQESEAEVLKSKEKKITELDSVNTSLKKKIDALEVDKKGIQNQLNTNKSEQAFKADKQIEVLLQQKFDKPGNLILDRNLILSIQDLANDATPSKLNQLRAYIEIYDSLMVVKKVFELPYNEQVIQQANNTIQAIELSIKKKLNANPYLTDEVENVKKLISRYCSNTFELHSLFAKIYPLAKTDLSSVTQTKSAFRKEIEQAYFLVYQYKYLNDMLNKYLLDSGFREQFKEKPTFTCK